MSVAIVALATTCVETQLSGWSGVQWDPMASSPGYAVLAGLLFAFATVGLLQIAIRPVTAKSKQERLGVSAVWYSLAPLGLSTLIYAEIEGDTGCNQALMGGFTAALLLAAGAMLLFIGIAHLLHGAFLSSWEARGMVALLLFLTTFLVWEGNRTILESLYIDGGPLPSYVMLGGFTIALISVLARMRPGTLAASWRRALKFLRARTRALDRKSPADPNKPTVEASAAVGPSPVTSPATEHGHLKTFLRRIRSSSTQDHLELAVSLGSFGRRSRHV